MIKKSSDEQATAGRYLSAREVSARLEVSVNQLWFWRSKGEGPAYYKMGGSVRYRLEDIEQFERDSKVGGARP